MRALQVFLMVLLCKIFHNWLSANPIQGLFDPKCFVAKSECPNENVTFWLYTKATANEPLKLDPLNLQQTDFPTRRPVKILIHGYTGHRDFAPNTFIRPVLLEHEDVYVISPDYGPLVREPCYASAVENLALVSRCLGQLINNLVGKGIVRNEDLHVIGFSLGAQVAGQTANYVANKLPRITGLDPAKPLFITAGNERKLSKDDADFVDVIHTDVLGRGMMHPMGHVDFYPNFGYIQPGCEIEAAPGSCNHERAPRFYAESIIPKYEFWSSRCSNWLYFVLNICSVATNDAMMGYHIDKSLTGIYFLKTSNSTPFALGRITEKVTQVKPKWRQHYELDMLNEEACDQLLMCRFLRYGVDNPAADDGTDVILPPDFINFFHKASATAGKIGTGFPFDCIYANEECPNEHIKFWLYKNETNHESLLLNPLNLTAANFEPRWPLKILIHGFNGNRFASPNLETRAILLRTQPVHVISADYSRLSRFPCYYPWAVRNAHVVARCLAQLVDNLIESGIYSERDIHLIGFSLGAQIAGLTANSVRQPLHRITGLDPAGPAFVTQNLRDKLDASDAEFVDVIHTDPFFYSTLERSGHADFYPNLEQFFQPGCNLVQDGRIRNCNHFRAPAYYAESIGSERGFWSYQCGEWFQFVMQQCRQYAHVPHTQMGYFVSRNASGSYFLQTEAFAPFAKGPIVGVELDITKPAASNLKK
ncbi:uncharacterized protein LOC101462111 [Ceratitis capitata]|uniref:uncharacterized protein LOC101462111 n=1 Tax=Ceratitis capitata TaxID=7213 RepID=UPI000A102755|nr:uncharacterized protein LOC101462111 [Ceratitis capitata]